MVFIDLADLFNFWFCLLDHNWFCGQLGWFIYAHFGGFCDQSSQLFTSLCPEKSKKIMIFSIKIKLKGFSPMKKQRNSYLDFGLSSRWRELKCSRYLVKFSKFSGQWIHLIPTEKRIAKRINLWFQWRSKILLLNSYIELCFDEYVCEHIVRSCYEIWYHSNHIGTTYAPDRHDTLTVSYRSVLDHTFYHFLRRCKYVSLSPN